MFYRDLKHFLALAAINLFKSHFYDAFIAVDWCKKVGLKK